MAEVKVRVTAENATRTGFQQALGEAKRFGGDASSSIQSSFQNIGGSLKSTFAGIFAGIGIGSIVRNTISELSSINDLSQQFGISAESLQRLGQVASESGVSLEQVGAALGKLTRSVQAAQGGTGAQADALRDLGLSAKELAGLSPEQAFLKLADAVAGATDRKKAYAATIAVAGRNAGALIPILQQGSAALKEQFDSIGVVSDETVNKIDQIEDAFSRLGKQATVALGEPIAFFGKFALAGTEAFKFVAVEAKNLVGDIARAAGAVASLDFDRAGQIFSDGDKTSLKNLEEFERRVSDIFAQSSQESVRLALEATGLENATELQEAIKGSNSKTIDIAVKASGLKSVEELNAAIQTVSRGSSVIDLDEASGAGSSATDKSARAEENTRKQIGEQVRRLKDQRRTEEERLAALKTDEKFLRQDVGGVSQVELERLRVREQIRALEDQIAQKQKQAAERGATTALQITGLESVAELERALDVADSKTVRIALEATGLSSADELRAALDQADNKTVQLALEATGLSSAEELQEAISGTDNKTVRLALEATGLGGVEELRAALNSADSKVVELALEATGADSAVELEQAIAAADSKTIRLALEATGLNSVEQLKETLNSADSKNVQLALQATGLSSAQELRAAIDQPQNKTVELALEATGLDNATQLKDALQIEDKTVVASLEAAGLNNLDALRAALEEVQPKRVDVILNALGVETIAEARAQLDTLDASAQAAIDRAAASKQELARAAEESKQELARADARQNLGRTIEQRDFASLSTDEEKQASIRSAESDLIAGIESGEISPAEAAARAIELQNRQDSINDNESRFGGSDAASSLQRVGLASNEFFDASANKTTKAVQDTTAIVRRIATLLEGSKGLYLERN
jgi:hypothetical protein